MDPFVAIARDATRSQSLQPLGCVLALRMLLTEACEFARTGNTISLLHEVERKQQHVTAFVFEST